MGGTGVHARYVTEKAGYTLDKPPVSRASKSGDGAQEAGHIPCDESGRWTALLPMQQHRDGMQELSDSATT